MKSRVRAPEIVGSPVSIDMLIDAHDLAFTQVSEKQQRPQVQFFGQAWDSNGKQCGSFSEIFSPLLTAAQMEMLLHNGMQFHQPMTLASGSYQLRLGIMDRFAGRLGTLDIPLTIPRKQATQ